MSDDRTSSSRLREALPLFTALAMALLAAVIVVALYLGRDVFVPLALAVLLSFVLAPLVRLLQHLGLPRGVAVVGVVGLAFVAIFGIGTVIVGQVSDLAGDLPRYQSTIREKVRSLRGAARDTGALGRAADMLQDLGRELEPSARRPTGPGTEAGVAPAPTPAPAPIPVELREPTPGPLRAVASLITPLLHPLAMSGLIVIFVIFILMQREDLRNRFIRLAGAQDLQKTTAALDDAAHRLSRLFLMQLALNASFGVAIGVGLWLIGVPSPALWGILAGILRFVPYIGAFIAAAFPLALAVAVDPGWSMLIWTAALFVVIEPIVGHVLEPLLAGHSTGLSPLAVVLAATFWTLLWGPIGLVLATPLTVCLVVLGRHTERLRFIDVLLGDRPALSPAQIFYQRMLAADPAEAVARAEEFLKERSLLTYYDEVALEGLRLAHEDLARGALDPDRQATIRTSIREMLEELADEPDAHPPPVPDGAEDPETAAAVDAVGPDPAVAAPVLTEAELAPNWRAEAPVLCVAGRDLLDEGAALMLGQLLSRHGLATRVLGPEALASENLARLDPAGVALVCLSFMDAPSTVHIRYAVRRVRRKIPGAQVLVGVWRDRDPATLEGLRKQTAADSFVTALHEAVVAATEMARAAAQAGLGPQPTPAPVAVAAAAPR